MRTCMLLLFFFCGGLFAQNSGNRQSVDDSATDYLRSVDKYSILYYGDEQKQYPHAKNHPYLHTEQFSNVRLSFLQVLYPDVLLRWDCNRDELIVQSPENRNIVLFPENVDFAELHGYHIVYLQPDVTPGCPATGYYILLHAGKCKLLEKRMAIQQERPTLEKVERFFLFSTRYYLLKDGVYYSINGKNSLLKALSPYRRELKRFMSANRMKYRKNTESFLIQTVGEYEILSRTP